MEDLVEKIDLFQYSNGVFYIYVNSSAEVELLNDTTLMLKYYDKKEIEKLKKENKELKVRTTQYVDFLFLTDDQFKVKEIIPLYGSAFLEKNNYNPVYQMAFYAEENDLHVFLMKNNEGYETIRSKKDTTSYYTAVIDIKDPTKDRLLLNNNMIDYNGFTFDNYLGASTKFCAPNGKLLYFNGKEICEVKSGKKLFAKKNLAPNEWIKTFSLNEDETKLITINYNEDKKKHPTEFEKHYAVDSIHSVRIKVFDTNTSSWIAEKKITDWHFPFLITKNRIINIDNDKQHYYIKYMNYHEN